MLTLFGRARKLFCTAPRVVTGTFLLLLPFGYAPQEPDSALFEIGVHGGYGQIASIVRDCEGNPTSVETNTFSDVSGAVYVRQRASDNVDVVWGVRAGSWRSTAHFADEPDFPGHVTFSYVNPTVSLEGTKAGFGLGLSVGDVPSSYNELDDPELRNHNLISTHLRLGAIDGSYFLSTFNESEPLVSGGGLWTVGAVYRPGTRTQMYTAMSMLPYDPYDVGLMHQIRVRLAQNVAGDLAIRCGFAGGVFEGGASAGLVWRVGRLAI